MFGLKKETGPVREIENLDYDNLKIGKTFRWGVAGPGFVDDCGIELPTVIDLEWTIVAIHCLYEHQHEGLETWKEEDKIIIAKSEPYSEVRMITGPIELPELRMVCRIISPWGGGPLKLRRLFLWQELA